MTDVEKITLQLIRARIGIAEYAHKLVVRHNCGFVSDHEWCRIMAMYGAIHALMDAMVWNDPDNYEQGEIGCQDCNPPAQALFEWLINELQRTNSCCETNVEIRKILDQACPCCNTCECESVVADLSVSRMYLSSFPGYRIVIDMESSLVCSGTLGTAPYTDEVAIAYAIYNQAGTLLWYVSIKPDDDASVPGNWTYFSGTLPFVDFQNNVLPGASGTGKKWYLDESVQTHFLNGDTMKIVAYITDSSCEVDSSVYDVDHITISV